MGTAFRQRIGRLFQVALDRPRADQPESPLPGRSQIRPTGRPAGARIDAATTPELRILVVSPWGIGGGYSGPLVLLNRLFEAAAMRHECRVDVLFRDRGDEQVPAWTNGAVGIPLGTRVRFGRADQLAWAWRVRRHLARTAHEYDFIHLHGAYVTAALALWRSRSDTPYCLMPVVENGDLARATLGTPASWTRRLTAKAVRGAVLGVALSDGIRRELQGLGMPAADICILPNPVPTSQFYPGPKVSPTERTVRLGFVGKVGRTKNPTLLLEALNILHVRGIGATAIFVGPFESAGFEALFMATVQRLGLEEFVTVTGYREDVSSYMRESFDIFVLPSSSEGLPGSLAEAMACGVPCVVTDVGAMRYHVEASQAGVVVEASAPSVAGAIVKLLHAPMTWIGMSRNASSYASSTFGVDIVATRYVDAVSRAVRARDKTVKISVHLKES